MRNLHTGVLLLLGAVLTTAGYLTLQSFGLLVQPSIVDVKPLQPGYQEIAWISPATSADTWTRMVEAAESARDQWPPPGSGLAALQVDTSMAFPDRSTDIPELLMWVGNDESQKLVLRWYKISSEVDIATWVKKLSQRETPPLAVMGGESTNRAVEIAETLVRFENQWKGLPPLFLITTATADDYKRNDNDLGSGQPLMELYQRRNYRFSFTNTLMACSVLDFVAEHPEIWPDTQPILLDMARQVGSTQVFNSLAATSVPLVYPKHACYAVAWEDNDYSKDLQYRFSLEFSERYNHMGENFPETDRVLNSVGDFTQPSSHDIGAAWRFINSSAFDADTRQLLILPAGAQEARRYLRALVNSAPDEIRNMVALSGDSIAFNHIYRDRKLTWNVMDLPVPLIFFSHRNPIDRVAGFRREGTKDRPWAATGTQDLLFYRDMIEAVLLAAYSNDQLVSNSEVLNKRLSDLRWESGRVTLAKDAPEFFDASRNRNIGTGEHIVWLQPHRDWRGRVLPESTITVWFRQAQPNGTRQWKRYGSPLQNVLYGPAPSRFEQALKSFPGVDD